MKLNKQSTFISSVGELRKKLVKLRVYTTVQKTDDGKRWLYHKDIDEILSLFAQELRSIELPESKVFETKDFNEMDKYMNLGQTSYIKGFNQALDQVRQVIEKKIKEYEK